MQKENKGAAGLSPRPSIRRLKYMEQYKKEFIEFMIDCNVLKFGDFVTVRVAERRRFL